LNSELGTRNLGKKLTAPCSLPSVFKRLTSMDDLCSSVFVDLMLTSKSNIYSISLLRVVSSGLRNIVDTNIMYKRKKAAEYLRITLNESGYNMMFYHNLVKWPFSDDSRFKDFRIFTHSIYNVGSNFKLNDDAFALYKRNLHSYKSDMLDPLHNLRTFKYYEVKRLIRQSVNLSVALDHADKTSIHLKPFLDSIF
jgi:hypothetical protein